MRKLLFLLVVFSFSGCYMFQKQKTFYGMSTDAKNIVFVIDLSGSMEGKSEGGVQGRATAAAANAGANVIERTVGGTVGRVAGSQLRSQTTKLGAAKRELIPTLKGLPETSKFTLLTFDDQVKTMPGGPMTASSTNKNVASLFVDRLSSGGSTSAKAALEAAFRIANIDAIFFLSDGQPTDASADEILRLVTTRNRTKRVVVNTVGLGEDQDENFMRTLASQNGGQYFKK
jgi:uncharacterized protein YegL